MIHYAPVTKREPTRSTEIAALKATYNEQQVLAAGAGIGGRRTALARLAMIANAFRLFLHAVAYRLMYAMRNAAAMVEPTFGRLQMDTLYY
ncbi:MAG: hypothetical protein ACM3IK_02525 [Sphingomonadaceae bacterium]